MRAGRFAVQLGASDGPAPVAGFEPLPDEVFEAVSLYLAIQVDNAELSGRQRLNTVPWSVRSAHALDADYAIDAEYAANAVAPLALQLVPTGTVVSFFGATAPPGWLLCDGTARY